MNDSDRSHYLNKNLKSVKPQIINIEEFNTNTKGRKGITSKSVVGERVKIYKNRLDESIRLAQNMDSMEIEIENIDLNKKSKLVPLNKPSNTTYDFIYNHRKKYEQRIKKNLPMKVISKLSQKS